MFVLSAALAVVLLAVAAPLAIQRYGWSRGRPMTGLITGVALGAAYGLMTRFAVTSARETSGLNEAFLVMTFGFIGLVPLAIGWITVRPASAPSLPYRIFAPWGSCLAVLAAAFLIGWEGTICIVMAAPIMLVASSIGGLLAGLSRLRRGPADVAMLVLPLVLVPLEARLAGPMSIRSIHSEVEIDANAAIVWNEIVNVRTIHRSERRPALFTSIGFPPPVSAITHGGGVGSIRHARFEGNIVFIETVTRWDPERRLTFSIDADHAGIPASTLDPHVTIGGPFFDVLDGDYRIVPSGPGRVRLLLTSRHRVSTRFNIYAGLWSDAIMRSIQRNILEVIRARAAGSKVTAEVENFGHYRSTSRTRTRPSRISCGETAPTESRIQPVSG